MQAGKLDRRITIERATTTTNSLGEEVPSWGAVATVWAEVLPISDGERWRAAEVAANVTTRFRIRWLAGITAKDRVVYEGRTYDIAGLPKEIGRRDGLEITASARAE